MTTNRMLTRVAVTALAITLVSVPIAPCDAAEVTITSHEVFCHDAAQYAKCTILGRQEGSVSPYPMYGWFGLDRVGAAERDDFLGHCGSGHCQVTLGGAQAEPGGYIDEACAAWTAEDGGSGRTCVPR